MTERITDGRLARMLQMANADVEILGDQPKRRSQYRYAVDVESALRELSERRERERWIPVAERLPEGDGMRRILTRSVDGNVDISAIVYLRILINDAQANGEECRVKEWREVPE